MNDITIEWQGQVVEVTATLAIGGGVESVTGYSVDNTDVKNPIVNAVPLSGTEGGSPVTGDIEFESGVFIKTTDNSFIELSDVIRIKPESEGGITISNNVLIIDYINSNSEGIQGAIYYGANYTDNTYVQKKYVDDTKNIGKTFENLTATGAIDIDVSLYDSIKLHLTGNTTLTFINTPTGTKTKAINMVVTTENGTETLGLSSATNYYYAGEFDAAIRNKFAIDFSSYTTSGLEVDVFINETTNI